MAEVDTMARKPEESEPESRATRKPMVVQVRGSEQWKAWAEGLAEKEGHTLAKLVEMALRKWAKDVGYPDPPKR